MIESLITLALLVLVPSNVQATDVLFVGGAASATQGADGAVMGFLEGRYGAANVTYMQASAASSGDETPFDVLVISSTLGSGSVRNKFHNSAVPVVNWEEAVAEFESVLAMDFSDPAENFYFSGRRWDVKARSAVWLRSFAHDFGDTTRYEQYDAYLKAGENEFDAPIDTPDFAFPHGFYEKWND